MFHVEHMYFPCQLSCLCAGYFLRRLYVAHKRIQGERMNKISKGLLALALGLATAAFAFAQDTPPPSGQNGDQQGPPPQRDGMRGEGRGGRMPSPEERLKRMTEALNLTADQQTKIKGFMDSEKTKMDALRDDTSVERDAKREKAMQIRKDTQASIR